MMPRFVTAVVAWVWTMLIAGAAAAEPEQRTALVIGNAAYMHQAALSNPVNDANAMAASLRRLGFEVVLATNADRNAMVKALGEFRKKLRTDGVALFYYAGHGMQVRGKNWLLPVDADINSEGDAQLLGFDQEAVQNEIEDAGVRLSILIFDACRDNPFERRFRSAGSRGLAAVDAARGTLLAYATSPGKTASDGESGNGLYTSKLLEAMVKPGLSLEEVFKETAAAVEKASGNRQTPWYNSAFHGTFYFSGPVTVNAAPLPPAPAPATPSIDPELLFWQTIAQSANAADFEEYLRKYPNGQFAGLARNRVASMRTPPKQIPEKNRDALALSAQEYKGNPKKWMAFAIIKELNVTWVSDSNISKQEAIKNVMESCKKKFQQDCVLTATSNSECLGIARRANEFYFVLDVSPRQAALRAIEKCETELHKPCGLHFTTCPDGTGYFLSQEWPDRPY